ncbi:MAG: hypothetical protein EPO21_19630, partial [Chloroflexota bacterium]
GSYTVGASSSKLSQFLTITDTVYVNSATVDFWHTGSTSGGTQRVYAKYDDGTEETIMPSVSCPAANWTWQRCTYALSDGRFRTQSTAVTFETTSPVGGWSRLQLDDVTLTVSRASGMTTSYAGSEWSKYYRFNGQLLAQRRTLVEGSTLYWYLSDHLGGQQRVVNAVTGQVVSTSHYFPFGEKNGAKSSGTSPTAHEFTGQEFDVSTDLYYYGARYYAPWLGRFVQPDTIVPDPANPQTLNRYAYVYNNPLRYSDPSGHCPLCVLAAVLVVGALMSPSVANAPGPMDVTTPSDLLAPVKGALASAPVIGDINDALAATAGKDFLYGEDLSLEDRAITLGAGALPFVAGHATRRARHLGDDASIGQHILTTRPPNYETARRRWYAQHPAAPKGGDWHLDHRIPRKYEWDFWSGERFPVNDPSNLRLVPEWVNLEMRDRWRAWEREMAVQAGESSGRWRPTFEQAEAFARELDAEYGVHFWR